MVFPKSDRRLLVDPAIGIELPGYTICKTGIPDPSSPMEVLREHDVFWVTGLAMPQTPTPGGQVRTTKLTTGTTPRGAGWD